MTSAADNPLPVAQAGTSRLRRLLSNKWIMLYLALLIASQITVWVKERDLDEQRTATRAEPGRIEVVVPKMRTSGSVVGSELRVSIVHTGPAELDPAKVPVILLHGSPSSGGDDFQSFAPVLAEQGYDCYAIDLPGFGASEWRTASYSLEANGRLALAVMDELGIDRAHVIGWSQGGGSALHMAGLAPERIASLVMMASVGAQETEGSGSYYFEHTKYFIGKVALWTLPEVVPHFAGFGKKSLQVVLSRAFRYAALRNFADSDQRKLTRLMPTLETPTLILQGRHDPLVPAWGAEKHFEMMPASSLVMFDASHFLPGQSSPAFDGAVAHTLAHLQRYDSPGAAALHASTIYAPESSRRIHTLGGIEISRELPWQFIIIAILLASLISEDFTIITVGLLIVSGSLEWSVGIIGCFSAIVMGDLALWGMGRFIGRRLLKWPFFRGRVNEKAIERWGRVFDKHTGKAVMMSRFIPGTRLPTFLAAGMLGRKTHQFVLWVMFAAFLWTPFLLLLTVIIGPSLLGVFEEVFHGPWAIVAAIVALFIAFRLLSYETTPQGRDRLKADLARVVRREFWPAWLYYLPLVPRFCWLSLRYGGPMSFSCANPCMTDGGGFLGESKQEIIDGLFAAGSVIAPARLVARGATPKQRADEARRLIANEPQLGGYPVVLKPDSGYKGYGLHISESPDDLDPYFEQMIAPVQIQKYHPGPHEIGVLWARVPEAGKPVEEWSGEIFSATHKVFPVIVGDGKRSLERLIWDHPRYRMQAKVFHKRFTGELDRVLDDGESLGLGRAGNHAQGAMFTDGMDKITPQLAERLGAIVRAYRDPETGKGFDFGRFDLRYESLETLGRGEGFVVIELNGTASESTSMYAPDRSIVWSYSLLMRHWTRLFQIGSARRREGVRPMSPWRLLNAFQEARPHNPAQKQAD